MRKIIVSTLFMALALAWSFQDARAGAIRFAGKKFAQGSTAVAGATADGAQAAGGAVKTGAVTVGKGAKATPRLIARGGKSIAKAVW